MSDEKGTKAGQVVATFAELIEEQTKYIVDGREFPTFLAAAEYTLLKKAKEHVQQRYKFIVPMARMDEFLSTMLTDSELLGYAWQLEEMRADRRAEEQVDATPAPNNAAEDFLDDLSKG